jgi:murein tripeptide amidase MpaA
MAIRIDAAFDSGNIDVLGFPEPTTARLAIRADAGGEFRQWFHFRVSGAAGARVRLRIEGLKASAYPGGWPGYRARVSADRQYWVQAPTEWLPDEGEGTLAIDVVLETGLLWVAYFAPYSMERHQDLVARMAGRPGVRARVLGQSLDGQPIDCLTMGEGKRQVWLHARQHPGETMAEWWMEGALEELTDPASAVSRELRRKATIHLVPNMNPDGSRRGYLRTNAAGANLNREWKEPTAARAPEVLAVRDAMDASRVDLALDVHGDEALPHVFVAGFEGVPGVTQAQLTGLERLKERLLAHSPDFQTAIGYPVTPPGKANLAMATNQVAHRFGCVAATLEMPFKDADDCPEPVAGWSPARAKRLAVACLAAINDVLGD